MKKLNLKIEDLKVENFQSTAMSEVELAGTHPSYCGSQYGGPCETFEPEFCRTNPHVDCVAGTRDGKCQSIINRCTFGNVCSTQDFRCHTDPRTCNETHPKVCQISRTNEAPGRPGCP